MKKELYQKVYIKDQGDLPKEEGDYTISVLESETPTGSATFNFLKKNIKWWLDNVHWYYRPVESPLPDISDLLLEEAFEAGRAYQYNGAHEQIKDEYYKPNFEEWLQSKGH
jgi:hypothetical protein